RMVGCQEPRQSGRRIDVARTAWPSQNVRDSWGITRDARPQGAERAGRGGQLHETGQEEPDRLGLLPLYRAVPMGLPDRILHRRGSLALYHACRAATASYFPILAGPGPQLSHRA